jgi:hypothetical protein
MKRLTGILILLSTSAFASLIQAPQTSVTSASSLADKQAASVQMIQAASTHAYDSLKSSVMMAFGQVWHNMYGLTPAQVEAGLGKDACMWHMLFLSANEILNAAQPGSFTLTEPQTVTCNSDGSVSLSPLPAPSPKPSATPSSTP